MGIYVEIFIRGSMDDLWERTQNPCVHQRWDLRFSQIEYLPRAEGGLRSFFTRLALERECELREKGRALASMTTPAGGEFQR